MNQPQKKDDGPTFIALIFILLISFGLMGMTAMVLPQIAGFVIVIGGFTFICAFHYLTWGRLLKVQPEEVTDESDDNQV